MSTIIGIPERGQSSRYVDIESVNGTKFTLRLSNHNAKVSNFDSRREKEGISIVISRQANNRMTNDGDAHVVENFYPDKKLQNTEDALVKILQSVQQMFYSGKYKDTTGLAEQEEVNIPDFHRTFHGTAANFDVFDFSHMGEGEGAQFYGWGGYVTDVEGVGRKYAESASPTPLDYPMAIRSAETSLHLHQKMSESIEAKVRKLKDELEDLEIEAEDRKMEGFKTQTERELHDESNRQIQEIKEKINFFESEESQQRQLAVESEGRLADLHKEYDKWLETKNSRHLYTVEIPDDNGANYLDYTKGLNKEQAAKLNQAVLNKLSKEQQDILSERLQGLAMLNEPTNGRNVYDALRSVLGSPKAASEFLSEAGFTGIKYPTDYLAGGNTEGHSNFVIFNDADMRIIDHVTFLRSSDGIIYGWTVNGEIFLNMDAMNPETPIHEYTHMWDSMIQLSNPKL